MDIQYSVAGARENPSTFIEEYGYHRTDLVEESTSDEETVVYIQL